MRSAESLLADLDGILYFKKKFPMHFDPDKLLLTEK